MEPNTPIPHPYYIAHYTEVESVVLAWRAYTERDEAKAVVAAEVMGKMVERKAGMLANGFDPVEADGHRQRAEDEYDRDNPGIRAQAYAYMRSQLADWQGRQKPVAQTGCLIVMVLTSLFLLMLTRTMPWLA